MDILNDLFAPSVSHRFMTLFMFNGIPSPLDLSFQKTLMIAQLYMA